MKSRALLSELAFNVTVFKILGCIVIMLLDTNKFLLITVYMHP